MATVKRRYSDSSLIYLGRARPGIPLIEVDRIVDCATSLYLLTRHVDDELSMKSVELEASALRHFVRWCASEQLPVKDVLKDDIVRFREFLQAKGLGGSALEYLETIDKYFAWLKRQGWILARPFTTVSAKNRRRLVGGSVANPGTPVVRAKKRSRTLPRVVSPEEYGQVRAAIWDQTVNPDIALRTDCYVRCTWSMGLRADEAASLEIPIVAETIRKALPRNLRHLADGNLQSALDQIEGDVFEMDLDPNTTKNNRVGKVLIVRSLLKKLVEWIEGPRKKWAKPGEMAVFISSHSGRRMNVKSIYNDVRISMRKVGLSGGVHRLRHTFISRVLVQLVNRGYLNPEFVTKELARHASFKTTQIYIHVLAVTGANKVAMLIMKHLDEEV